MGRTIQAYQVADAFNAVPGVSIEILQNVASGVITSSTTTFAEIDSTNLSGSFVVPVAGKYRINYDGEMRINTYGSSTYATPQLQILIDDSVVVGGDDADFYWSFQSRVPAQQWFRNAYHDEVELTAGTHTFKMRWKVRAQSASGATMEMNSGSVQHITATLITGSGAGGIILDQVSLGSAWFSSGLSTSWVAVQGSSGDVVVSGDFFEGEDAELTFMFGGTPVTASTDATYRIGIGIDGADPVYEHTWQRRLAHDGNSDPFRDTFTCVFENLSAGSHTFKLYAQYATLYSGSGPELQISNYSNLALKQYRGGQIPWELNGVQVLDTPRAINIVGGAMEVADDGTSKLEVRLPEAVTAPNNGVILSGYPTSDVTLNTTSYQQIFPNATDQTFTTKSSGTHKVYLRCHPYIDYVSGADNFQFKVEFDDGVNPVIVAGDDVNWSFRVNSAYGATMEGFFQLTFVAQVNLEINTAYTVKAYGKRVGSASISMTIPSTTSMPVHVEIEPLTGSGAGGSIRTTRVHDQEWTSSGLGATWTAIQDSQGDITLTVDTIENETIELYTQFGCRSDEDNVKGRFRIGWGIDGSDPTTLSFKRFYLETSAVAADDNNVRFTEIFIFENLSAGQHIFKFYIQKDSDITGTPEIIVSVATIHVITQYRGGLVPIKKDGVQVLDTPQAFNFVGPNTTVQNVGGEANIEFNGIAEGLTQSASGTFTNYNESQSPDGVTWYPVLIDGSSTNLEKTITAVEGENIIVTANLTVKPQNTTSNNDYIIVSVFVDNETTSRFTIGSCSGVSTVNQHHNLGFSKAVENLSAGSHTIKLKYLKSSGSTYNFRFTDGQLSVLQNKGGYVQKENEPVLGTFSGDTVQLIAAPGDSNTSHLVLNDGIRYRATLPLTVDLTNTGALGREASKSAPSGIDHWFLYAIPSATDGEYTIIGTTKSPGDGGPDDYSVWKYLHPVIRYDGTEGQPTGLIPMTVGADGWYVLEQRLVFTEIKALTGWTAKSYIDVPELPQSADQAMVNFLLQATGNAAGDRSVFRWYKDTSATEDYLFTIQQNNVVGQVVEQTECGVIQLAEGTANRCAIAVEQIAGTPGFLVARAHALRFTDRYKRVGQNNSPKIITSGEYIFEDKFNDSSLDPKWTVNTPGSTTVVEGSDGVVFTNPQGSTSDPSMVMDVPFSDMVNRNWLIQVHMTAEYIGTPNNSIFPCLRLVGLGNNVGKHINIRLVRDSSTVSYLRSEDSGGNAPNNVSLSSGASQIWVRLRKFGNLLRIDYHEGNENADVDGEGKWQEYVNGREWYVVPRSGTFNYPTKYQTVRLYGSQSSNDPGITATFRHFKFQVL